MGNEVRAAKIKLLIFDVDGVLTDGKLAIGRDGEMLKEFFAQDGMGIALAQKNGIRTAIITGRQSDMVRLRGAELNIGDIYQGSMDKLTAFQELLTKYNIVPTEAGYVGDDLNDLPVMTRVGLACAVANAVPEVKECAHLVTVKPGGAGGVREVIEFILKAQGKWESIVTAYCQGGSVEIQQ